MKWWQADVGRWKVGRFIWVILALALLCRLAVFAAALRHPEPRFTKPDSTNYLQAAGNIRLPEAFLDRAGRSRPPGYPLFLSAFLATGSASIHRVEAVVLAQIVLDTLTVAFACMAATRFAGPRTGLMTAALLAIEPSMLSFSNLVMAESLYVFILTALVWSWCAWIARLRVRELAAAALLTGLLPLVRAVGLYLPLPFVLIVWLTSPKRDRLRFAAIYLALALVIPFSWTARNYYYVGAAEFSNAGPLERALFARELEDLAGVAHPGSASPQTWDRDLAQRLGVTAPEAMEIQNQYFLKTIAAHPLTAFRKVVTRWVFTVGVPDAELPWLVLSTPPLIVGGSVRERLLWLLRVGPLSVLLLFGVAVSLGGLLAMLLLVSQARTWDADRRGMLVFLVTITLYHLAFGSFLAYQAARYRVPVIPVLAMTLSALAMAQGPRGISLRTAVQPARHNPAKSREAQC